MDLSVGAVVLSHTRDFQVVKYTKGQMYVRDDTHAHSYTLIIPRYPLTQSLCVPYCISIRYEAHLDYFDPDDYQEQPDVIEDMDLSRRNRLATVFWYIRYVHQS